MNTAYIRYLFKKCTSCQCCDDQIPFNNLDEEQRARRKNRFILTGLIALIITVIIVIAVLIATEPSDPVIGCEFNPYEIDPGLIIVLSKTNDFIYPKFGEKNLQFERGQSIDFICPGRNVTVRQSNTNNSILTGTCTIGSGLNIGDDDVDVKDLKCNDIPIRTYRYTGESCANNGTEIEGGFDVGNNRFLRSLLICFNKELQVAYYTYARLPASINQRILNTPRPQFQQGTGFYNISSKLNNLYIRRNQRRTINALLGLNSSSTKYIQDNDYFLSRGHMIAAADNFYAFQQNATFFYPNAAPQWQTFNGKNWNQIEIDIRDYAEFNAVELETWTGVYGVTTLPHSSTGAPVKLYLFVDANNNRKALPVPEIYWKVAYNPETERGIALIGVNNPYNANFTTLCPDVSSTLKWLHCDRNNQQQGFCYACSVDSFRHVVNSVPNIVVKGLLL